MRTVPAFPASVAAASAGIRLLAVRLFLLLLSIIGIGLTPIHSG